MAEGGSNRAAGMKTPHGPQTVEHVEQTTSKSPHPPIASIATTSTTPENQTIASIADNPPAPHKSQIPSHFRHRLIGDAPSHILPATSPSSAHQKRQHRSVAFIATTATTPENPTIASIADNPHAQRKPQISSHFHHPIIGDTPSHIIPAASPSPANQKRQRRPVASIATTATTPENTTIAFIADNPPAPHKPQISSHFHHSIIGDTSSHIIPPTSPSPAHQKRQRRSVASIATTATTPEIPTVADIADNPPPSPKRPEPHRLHVSPLHISRRPPDPALTPTPPLLGSRPF